MISHSFIHSGEMIGKTTELRDMENDDTTATRASIGFPLGLALLVSLLLFVCCFFCCCLHWHKLQSLFRSIGFINSQPHVQSDFISSDQQKPAIPVVKMKQKETESMPVLMPGDEVPKFIAIACPCQPPIDDERITIQVHEAAPVDFCSAT